MSHHPHRAGFALLLTLALVALAAVALAGVARRSVTQALDVRQATMELKRRWAVASLSRALLPRTEVLLAEQEDEARKKRRGRSSATVSELRIVCQLGGLEHELVIADEQAKVNLNELHAVHGLDRATAVVKRLTEKTRRGQRGDRVRVNIRKLPDQDSDRYKAIARLGAFGQVFDGATPQALVGQRTGEGLTAGVTLWGSGVLNIRRATPLAIEEVCRDELGLATARALGQMLDENPDQSLDEILQTMAKTDDIDIDKVLSLLTDRSNCHSLWIVSRAPSRSWYYLAVASSADPGDKDDDAPRRLLRLVNVEQFCW